MSISNLSNFLGNNKEKDLITGGEGACLLKDLESIAPYRLVRLGLVTILRTGELRLFLANHEFGKC